MSEAANEEVRDPAAVLAELRRAQEDLKVLRAEYDKARDELKAIRETVESDEWRNRALSAETKVALRDQGIKDVDRLMKYIGTDGLDFDDKGKVTGLEERLKTLKTDLPEVFDTKRRVGGRADIFANDTADVAPDPMREQIKQAIGQ